MAEPADINVDELRRRARRRLVGAVVLALGVAVVVPMLLETEQKPLGEDVSVRIPPIDSGKFVNRLNDDAKSASNAAPAAGTGTVVSPAVPDAGSANGTAAPAPSESGATPEKTRKYDTHVPDAASASSASSTPPAVAAAGGTAAAPATPQVNTAPVVIIDKGASPSPPSSSPTPALSENPAVASTSPHSGSDSGRTAHAKTAPPREGFAVQLAAFADDRGANSLAGRLKKAGYTAYTEPLKTSKGTLWRVRVGPYASREAAVAARDKLKTEGQSGIVAAIK